MFPLGRRIDLRKCLFIIAGVWFVGIVCTLPYGIFIDVVLWVYIPLNTTHHNSTQFKLNADSQGSPSEGLNDYVKLVTKPKLYCHEMWPADWMKVSYGIVSLIIQFIVPFLVIAFCYTKVCTRLLDRIKSRPGSRNCSNQKKWLEKIRTRRTNTMLISMVAIFAVAWLPLFIYNLVSIIFVFHFGH